MTGIALVHLLCLVAIATGFWVAEGHTVRGRVWFLVFLAWTFTGAFLAVSVLA